MKTLFLLRHAKAAKDTGGPDVDRPLLPEGVAAAERLGSFLAAAGVRPELLVTSPARRAAQTLERLAAAAGWQETPHRVAPLYDVTAATVLAEARQLPPECSSALLVGHEPSWSEATSRLIGGGAIHLSTSSIAAVSLDVAGWGEIASGRGRLLWLLSARLLATASAPIVAASDIAPQ